MELVKEELLLQEKKDDFVGEISKTTCVFFSLEALRRATLR